jgi:hypothetical protein
MQARFPGADLSGRFFRAVYSHGGRSDTTGAVDELEAIGVDVAGFLDPELSWEIEDCGVDERECLSLKASCSGESSEVIGALCVAARRSGASSALAILYDTSTGAYQALGASEREPVELYTTYDHDAVGDDFVAGVRRLLAVAHQHTKQLVADAILHPEAG